MKEFSSRFEITRSSFGRVEGENRKLVIGQEIERDSFFLKAIRPQAADSRKAVVDVPGVELHAEPAGFEGAVGQEILNELLQALATVAHVLQNFALALAERSQLLAVQQFDVSVQNRKRAS